MGFTVSPEEQSLVNESESIELRWMNLEPVIESEVSQKEKNGYPILTHTLEPREMVPMSLAAGGT